MPTGYPKRYPKKLDSEKEYQEMADKLYKMADDPEFYTLKTFASSLRVCDTYLLDWAENSETFRGAHSYAKQKIHERCFTGALKNKLNERMAKVGMWNSCTNAEREAIKAYNRAEACKDDDDKSQADQAKMICDKLDQLINKPS